jgi:hypothetical protein
MLRFLLAILVSALLLTTACDDEVFETSPSTGQLEFSRDTVFLDTVFTNISSSTRTFKVYNRSSQNISIPKVSLARGEGSFYRLNVNGIPGKRFENVEIPARDSIYVFVEATVDFESVSDPLYTDEVVFDEGSRAQEVRLVTLVQDAIFLFPERDADGIKETIVIGVDPEGEEIEVEGFYLEGSPVWTSEKPYVIYGFAGVKPGNTLTLAKGTRVYFHVNSGLVLTNGARLKVNGTSEKKVIFQGDRLEELFKEIPGQWSGILLMEGSLEHSINHAVVKNSVVGLLADGVAAGPEPGVKIENSEIYNTSSYGFFARGTTVYGSNLVVANNGSASLACTESGSYRWVHSTFANYWSGGIRNFPAVFISNVENQGGMMLNEFENSVIEGNQGVEFLLNSNEGSDFTFRFSNSLLRFEDPGGFFSSDPLYDFTDSELYSSNVFNGNPDFADIEGNDYRLGPESAAIGIGNQLSAQEVPFDLLGKDRRDSPDAGAYQHLIPEE